MYASVEPLAFTAQDLAHDHYGKLEKLIEQMETMDPAEAEDQVHEVYQFELCSRCRGWMHRQLRIRQPKQN
jgi:hypothetical protein